tara:strand:+ start:104 stop:934 length:831 start_codon:yes stop_codon:yes gene_type:complete
MREAMKECGLGTPATRAQILERLLSVDYITRDKNKLLPTEKGIKLIASIQDKELLSAELTGEWEKKLNDIAKKKYQRSDYMNEIKDFTKRLVNNVSEQQKIKDNLGSCPLCSKKVVETKLSYACSSWKETGCSFVIWKTIANKAIQLEEAQTLLKKGTLGPLKGFSNKEGKSFEATLVIKDGKTSFAFNDTAIGTCPFCSGKVIETPKAYSCSNWKSTGCSLTIWKVIAAKQITKEIAEELLKKGRTEKLNGFKSKKGTLFETILKLNAGKVEFEF